jgi:hypothetical protein
MIKIIDKYKFHNYEDKEITEEIEGAMISEVLPITIGISKDRSKIEIMDEEEMSSTSLSRDQVQSLAEEFRELAELMKP